MFCTKRYVTKFEVTYLFVYGLHLCEIQYKILNIDINIFVLDKKQKNTKNDFLKSFNFSSKSID